MTDEAKKTVSEEQNTDRLTCGAGHIVLLPPGANIEDYFVQDPTVEDPVEDMAPLKSEPTMEQLSAWRREMRRIRDGAITKIKEIEGSGSLDDLTKYKWVRRMASKQIKEVDNEVNNRLLYARQRTQPCGPLLENVRDRPMSLIEFDQRLEAILPENARPFLCEGSPLECTVFIVGLNPRTRTPFKPYWDVSYGCRRSEWLDGYMRIEGKKGRTRKYIDILHEAFGPIKCLETNIVPFWSNHFMDLQPKLRKQREVFSFLLDTIRPKLLLVHGRPAIRHIERLAGGAELPRDKPLPGIDLGGIKVDVYLMHHLSFHLKEEKCRSIGEDLRQHLLSRESDTPGATTD